MHLDGGPLRFPRKINFAHANHFCTYRYSKFLSHGKKITYFLPLEWDYYFSWASLRKFTWLVSFCFISIKLIFFEGIVFVYSFAGGIFTGTYLKFTRVTCTFSNFFRKEIIFTWKNTAYAYVNVFFKTSGNSLRSVSGSGSDPYSRSGSGSGSDKF